MSSAETGRGFRLQEITDQKIWDVFVTQQPWASFQQSWNWGEFKRLQGNDVRRVALFDRDEIVAAGQFIYYRRRFSGYWFCPRGPVFGRGSTDVRQTFRAFVEGVLAQKFPHATLFYRFEPPVGLSAAQGLIPMSFRRNHSVSPASTSIVDLSKSEDDLLAAMHPKTRYNIRVAEKHGVTVRLSSDIKTFLDLQRDTATRDAFTPHKDAYLKAMFAFLEPRGMARLRVAEHNGQALAANLEMTFGDTVTYLHGASSSKQREVMAPYALHWDAIRSAKREGYQRYDLWGVNPSAKSSYYYKPSWEGISRFKEGCGGEHVDLIGTWDLPTNLVLYRLAFLHGMVRG